MRAWLRKNQVALLIGVAFGLAPLIPKYLQPMEMGVLFVLLVVAYIVWLCCRRCTPSR